MSNVIPLHEDGPATVIAESNVTIFELERVLRSVVLDCERKEDRVYITDGLDGVCSVSLHEESKCIKFEMLVEWTGDVSRALRKINDVNGDLIMARFYLYDETIWADYFMTYDGGLNVRQFVKQLRRFAKIGNAVEVDVFSEAV